LAANNLIIAEDLNLTTSPLEIWGEKAISDPLMSFFKQLFYKNSLTDLEPAELLPTWRNGRQGAASISKRLDRFLISEEVLSPSRSYRAWVNLPYLSDHAAICLQIALGRYGARKPFIFNPLWLKEDSFNFLVRLTWADNSSSLPGDPQGNLVTKLAKLKLHTTIWLKEKKKSEQAAIIKIEKELDNLFRLQSQNFSNSDIHYRIQEFELARQIYL
jgi:hypothetical protein